jgi:hypothetical protein
MSPSDWFTHVGAMCYSDTGSIHPPIEPQTYPDGVRASVSGCGGFGSTAGEDVTADEREQRAGRGSCVVVVRLHYTMALQSEWWGKIPVWPCPLAVILSTGIAPDPSSHS